MAFVYLKNFYFGGYDYRLARVDIIKALQILSNEKIVEVIDKRIFAILNKLMVVENI